MSAGRINFAAHILPDGRALVAGGFSGMCPLIQKTGCCRDRDHSFYDLQEWYGPDSPDNHNTADGIQSSFPHGPSELIGRPDTTVSGRLTTLLDTAEVYDPDFDTWESLPTMPRGRAGAASCMLSDGRMALFGGYTQDSKDLNQGAPNSRHGGHKKSPVKPSPTSISFDIRQSRWVQLPAMPCVRIGMSATPIRGSVLITGGTAPYPEEPYFWAAHLSRPLDRGPEVSKECVLFDETSLGWYELPFAMTMPRSNHSSFSTTLADEVQRLTHHVHRLEMELANTHTPVFSWCMPDAQAASWTVWRKDDPATSCPADHFRSGDEDWWVPFCSIAEPLVVLESFLRGPEESLTIPVGNGGLQNHLANYPNYRGNMRMSAYEISRTWVKFLTSPVPKLQTELQAELHLGFNWSATVTPSCTGKRASVTVCKSKLMHERAAAMHQKKVDNLNAARTRLGEIDWVAE